MSNLLFTLLIDDDTQIKCNDFYFKDGTLYYKTSPRDDNWKQINVSTSTVKKRHNFIIHE